MNFKRIVLITASLLSVGATTPALAEWRTNYEAAREELKQLELRQATQTDQESTRATVPWWLFALLTGLLMVGFVLALPMSIFSTYAHREGAWLADVMGGALVGPLVHLAVVYRARLFLSIHGDPE